MFTLRSSNNSFSLHVALFIRKMILRRFLRSAVTPLSDVKVSDRGGSEAMFLDLLDHIRKNRMDKDPDVHRRPSDIIHRMTQQETELTRTLFGRLSEGTKSEDELRAVREHNIDPYWDPFTEVMDTRDKLMADYREYSAMASAAEEKKTRVKIKRALMAANKTYDSYTSKFRGQIDRDRVPGMPKPHRILEQFWQPSGIQGQINKENITWRDTDILQHFRAPNGYILPRRATMLSKNNHKKLTKAIKIAQHMALIPRKWNSKDFETMPLKDPLQWMVDRLTKRVERGGMTSRQLEGVVSSTIDKKITPQRAEAMLQVLMSDVAPDLNYSRFIKLLQKDTALPAKTSD
jgi:ribosomal protein S18